MVAQERMKLAETKEELKEAQLEKDALRSALRLVESQHTPPLPNEIAPQSVSSSTDEADLPDSPDASPSDAGSDALRPSHSRHRSSSSAIAIKSLPSTAPSSPLSSKHAPSISSEQPALHRSGIPDPIHVPPVPPPRSVVDLSPAVSSETESTPLAPPTAIVAVTPQSTESIYSTPSPDPDFPSLPSISAVLAQPSQATSSQYSFVSQRPLAYFEETESPWA